MPTHEWSIEAELCKLAATASPSAALAAMGLVSDAHAPNLLRAQSAWERSGAETYSYLFSVEESGRSPLMCRLKACVAYSAGSTIDEILSSWVERRLMLQKAGLSVPKLYAVGRGVLVEEEIPLSIREVLHGPHGQAVLAALLTTAVVLAKLRFAPINPFGDIRSRGADAVLLDFGADLGPSNQTTASPAKIFNQLVRHLDAWGAPLLRTDLAQLRDTYETRLGFSLQ